MQILQVVGNGMFQQCEDLSGYSTENLGKVTRREAGERTGTRSYSLLGYRKKSESLS